MNPLMADAIASLAATALERTHAFDKESRAEAARQSEQLRTTVLDALAHAFKTPLTVILTSTSGLTEMNDLNPAQAELVQLIDQHAIQLNALTTHLLRMAKLESSKIRLRRADVPVRQLVDEILAKCTDQLDGHSVQVCIPNKELAVFGDRDLLATTITEFVFNAAKYSGVASPIILSVQEEDKRVVIAVHNEGSLVRPGERELIFERFYRSPATKHRATGSGIGLSVAKKTAEAHQGSVWVTSNIDTGTTFFLSLPARREHEPVSK
jgi:two-component system sensor histidine kinase KdpD